MGEFGLKATQVKRSGGPQWVDLRLLRWLRRTAHNNQRTLNAHGHALRGSKRQLSWGKGRGIIRSAGGEVLVAGEGAHTHYNMALTAAGEKAPPERRIE